jgi:hypothetical protein
MAGIHTHALVGYIPTPEGVARAGLCGGVRDAEPRSAHRREHRQGRRLRPPQFATAEDIDPIDDLLSTKDVEQIIRRPGDGKPGALSAAPRPDLPAQRGA